MSVFPARTAVSVDIFSEEYKTELKDRDLASLGQEKGTRVLHSLARWKKEEDQMQEKGAAGLNESEIKTFNVEMLEPWQDDEG